MARFDPREKEVLRDQDQVGSAWIEVVLYKESGYQILVISNGDTVHTVDRDTEPEAVAAYLNLVRQYLGRAGEVAA